MVVAGWLLPQADVAFTTVLLGLGIGVGVGLCGGALDALRGRMAAIGAAAGIAVLAALVAVDGVHGTAWAGLLDGAAIATVGALARPRPRRHVPGAVRAAATVAAVATVGVTFWVGANSPTVNWFGSQVAHGSRDGRDVAITFDDGPDDPYTLEIARILDARGAKGTFFMVGKALDRPPDMPARCATTATSSETTRTTTTPGAGSIRATRSSSAPSASSGTTSGSARRSTGRPMASTRRSSPTWSVTTA